MHTPFSNNVKMLASYALASIAQVGFADEFSSGTLLRMVLLARVVALVIL